MNRLQKERKASGLDLEKLTEFLYGGSKDYKAHKKALDYVLKNTDFLDDDYGFYDRPRPQKREDAFANLVKTKKIQDDIDDPDFFQRVMSIMNGTKKGILSRYGLSVWFAGGGISGQGSKEQVDFFMPKLKNLKMTACYGITELATGSYVRNFQTTATYIPETDEFEIHTPNLLATKWWVGNAAQTATHGVIFARLILKGEDLGIHNFVVQLRDENFELCKGVKLGDVGPKRGSDSTDNGWMQFEHVRIPRTNMLMKWSQVSKDGEYKKIGTPQLAYGTLVAGRVMIARAIVEETKKALTIASRYCIVRDQFTIKGKSLMDYTTQQERLIGGISAAYAFHLSTRKLRLFYEKVAKELENKDTSNLKELHNNAAAMKGFLALWGSRTMNDCIMALGGHGFSSLSELPRLLADSAPTIPYEGDAILLVQQTASYLVKTAGELMQGNTIEGDSVKYLNMLPKVDGMKSKADEDSPLTLDDLMQAATWLSLSCIKDASMDLMTDIGKTGDQSIAWNDNQLKLIQASKAHWMYTVIRSFKDTLDNDLPDALGSTGKDLLPVLTKVAELFALRHIQENLNVFYEGSYFPVTRGKHIQNQIQSLYKELRPYTAQLVDAWDIHDQQVGTPLGRFDGDIYKHYFKAVNSLPQDTVPEYWSKYLDLDFE